MLSYKTVAQNRTHKLPLTDQFIILFILLLNRCYDCFRIFSNDFNISNNTNAYVVENENLGPQSGGLGKNSGRSTVGENLASHDQLSGRRIADRIRRGWQCCYENRVHDGILTAINNVVIPRVEVVVRSITGSSGRGPNSVAQNPDHEDFSENIENTPLKTASSRADLNNDQDRIDETRNFGNFEGGDFPVLSPNYDRQSHTHHSSRQFVGMES